MARKKCPKCKEYVESRRFCGNCGYKFKEDEPLESTTSKVVSQPKITQPESKLKGTKVARYPVTSVVYWSRFGLGILAALLCYILRLRDTTGIIFAAFLYMLSVIVIKNLRYGEEELQVGRKRLTLGVGTYIFTWAFVWIFLYTLWTY
ncbi:hypothetical protein [[Eubacterium] cellulosolvens]